MTDDEYIYVEMLPSGDGDYCSREAERYYSSRYYDRQQKDLWSIDQGTQGGPRWRPLSGVNLKARTTAMRLRARVCDLAEWCKDTPLYSSYSSLVAYEGVTGESVPQMLAREVRTEDENIFPRAWPLSAAVELGLRETVERVWVV